MLMKVWDTVDKEFDHDGHVHPGGPVRLTGVDFALAAHDRVTTRLSVVDNSFWPDLAMTIVYDERILVRDDRLGVDTLVRADADVIAGTWGLSHLPVLDPVFFLEAIIAAVAPRGLTDGIVKKRPGGFGAAFVELFPRQFLTSARMVLLVPADDGGVLVGPGGVTIKGGFEEADRQPTVEISGPSTSI